MLIRAMASGKHCLECLRPTSDGDFVEHTFYFGGKHRFHRNCLLKHVKTTGRVSSLFCPACYERLDVSSVLPWHKRYINTLTPILKDLAISGLVAAVITEIYLLNHCG